MSRSGGTKNEEVYVTRAMEDLKYWLKDWIPRATKCILVYGELGVGKTFTVRHVIKELGLSIIECGSDDEIPFEQLLSATKSRSWDGKRIVVFLDRPLRWMGSAKLKQLLKEAVNPIVIECGAEEKKYYEWLNCYEIPVYPPPTPWIVNQVKKKKIIDKPKYQAIGRDVRQAMLIALGSEGYRKEDWVQGIEKYFRRGDASELEPSHLPSLLDTGLVTFYGVSLYNFIQRLIVADLVKDLKVLDGLKPNKRSVEVRHRYYEKLKEVANVARD